jgi:hypothetical protein
VSPSRESKYMGPMKKLAHSLAAAARPLGARASQITIFQDYG